MEFWNQLRDIASFMLVAGVAAVLVYGIIIPAFNKNTKFGEDSLSRHPKIQYAGLVILSIAMDANSVFGGWTATLRDWLNQGGSFFAGMTAGQSLTGIASVVLAMIWLIVVFPDKWEPTNLGVPAHFVMWGISLVVYPMAAAAISVPLLIAMGVVLGVAIFSSVKSGGGRAYA
jgi:hypothetical protein